MQVRLLIISALLIALGCRSGPPLSVHRVSADVARRSIRDNVAATGKLSEQTRIALRRHDLSSAWEKNRADAIAALHSEAALGKLVSDDYFALAELNFKQAESLERKAWVRAHRRAEARRQGAVKKPLVYSKLDRVILAEARSYFLASAIYALTFLSTEDPGRPITRIDPRHRISADIYNRAVADAFANENGFLTLVSGRYVLPFGEIEIRFDEEDLIWENRRLLDLVAADRFEVVGLKNRYRRAGVGAPLAARTEPEDPDDPIGHLVGPRAVVPATLLLILDEPRTQLMGDSLVGDLELIPGTDARAMTRSGDDLPLEVQPSAALAASLQDPVLWESRLKLFFGRISRYDETNRLFGFEPWTAGQIPVVLVHGTSSTPVVWANLVNDLQSDPLIRERFHFLFFAYESGNPILYSAMQLRRALDRAESLLDPGANSPCLRDMVVVGHSQGGLLAKALVIDSGDSLWNTRSTVPVEETRLSPETKELVVEAFFLEPAPYVGRVVFLSTPHRGSYLASSDLVRRLAAWAIRFPSDLTAAAADSAGLSDEGQGYVHMRVTTSIDNMSPNNVLIKSLASIPVSPGTPANSIISVEGDGPIESGDDGVVKYKSAHIDEAESEVVVRSGHSSQSDPRTIEEMRRILRLHAAESSCTGAR